MASATVFGAKLRTWMSRMRGGQSSSSGSNTGSNSKDSSPSKSDGLDKVPKPVSRKKRKLNCMTVSSSQSFDRIRHQLCDEEMRGPEHLHHQHNIHHHHHPWDPSGFHPAVRPEVARRLFQAPRSVSLSSPESAYGSGNSEDSLTPASHPDMLHQFPARQYYPLQRQPHSYSSLRVPNPVDRPKIKTNPWVSFQVPQEDQQSQKQTVARTQSLLLRDKPLASTKRCQSFRSGVQVFPQSVLNRISSESESDWDEKDQPTSSIGAVCGSSKLNQTLSSPMKSMTFAGDVGFAARVAKKVHCPQCFLLAHHQHNHHQQECDKRSSRTMVKPALDSPLCAYCRSWILDEEEDSSTDVDTDSDFNDESESSSGSSCSSATHSRSTRRKLDPTAQQHQQQQRQRRRRQWRKRALQQQQAPPTVPPRRHHLRNHHSTISRELSTSCSSFQFEPDLVLVSAEKNNNTSSDDDVGSGNGNTLHTTASTTTKTIGDAKNDDSLGYKTLLTSMEALMAKFAEEEEQEEAEEQDRSNGNFLRNPTTTTTTSFFPLKTPSGGGGGTSNPETAATTPGSTAPSRLTSFRSRYTEEPLVKCRVDEDITTSSSSSNNRGAMELLQDSITQMAPVMTSGSGLLLPGDRRSVNSLEEKLKKLRQERMLLEAKIREARDEDRRRRKDKTSL
ncbi:unnamed protein product [Notodromas monacha]|uniref:Uncharacterized protein n=1 Tax=Notodromas monacha TaxID=399045 RepID=A0A7R9GCW5_9CRUS|nr:unnamed protein product [Notodromas monacha]CAG0917902.1 unnamed protein product [Notodromas monacha]